MFITRGVKSEKKDKLRRQYDPSSSDFRENDSWTDAPGSSRYTVSLKVILHL